MTTYVVLRDIATEDNGDGTFAFIGQVEAATPVAASKAIATRMSDDSFDPDGRARFHAIPLRNWEGGAKTWSASNERRIVSA